MRACAGRRANVGRRNGTRAAAVATLAGVAVALLVAACGSSAPGGASDTPSGRPSSPAKLSILSPRNGSVVHGSTVPLRLSLRDARIVAATSQDIRPDEGHVHVILDGQLISMNYQLDNSIPDVKPGRHILQAEFVASDHAPFDPRVIAVTSFRVVK
jgi:hypothetical protein